MLPRVISGPAWDRGGVLMSARIPCQDAHLPSAEQSDFRLMGSSMQDSTRYQPASEILDHIRSQLKEKPQDDMALLLKIFRDLKTIDASRMSPHDASRWLIQEQTPKERSFEQFVRKVGFNSGFGRGFLVGFAVCAFLALTMKYG
jgi:hypothetical protein